MVDDLDILKVKKHENGSIDQDRGCRWVGLIMLHRDHASMHMPSDDQRCAHVSSATIIIPANEG
jgi:hypothetical protein